MARERLRPWRPGDAVSADHLNETVTELRRLGQLLPPRELSAAEGPVREIDREPQDDDADDVSTDDDPVTLDDQLAQVTVDEQWLFVDAEEETTRITDPDDSDVYVDVTRKTSVVVFTPTGKLIRIHFE